MKWKDCHGSAEKRQIVQRFANAFMAQLIRKTKMEKGMIPYPFTCQTCGKGFEQPKPSKIAPGRGLCPHCDSTNITHNVPSTPEAEPQIIKLGEHA